MDNRENIKNKLVSDFGMEEYKELIEELEEVADVEYQEFHGKLIPGVESK